MASQTVPFDGPSSATSGRAYTVIPLTNRLPFSWAPATDTMVDGSQSVGFWGRFVCSPPMSEHSRTLIGTAPLGNPAVSRELRLSVELAETKTSRTWPSVRGVVATTPLEALNVTVPLESDAALACKANTPTTMDETRSTAPRTCNVSATLLSDSGLTSPAWADPFMCCPFGVAVSCTTLIDRQDPV